MLSKTVTSLQRSQNFLLESPTGFGKSLTLLWAALAWHEAEQKKCNMLVAMAGNDWVKWEDEM